VAFENPKMLVKIVSETRRPSNKRNLS